jgi:RNA polymerase sigma factor (TIGR02999 family)
MAQMSNPSEVTQLLKRIGEGDAKAPVDLLPLVYRELRKLAQGYMSNERSDHTLQATALVHEAYIRLVDWKKVSWQNRAHFFAVAAQVMRKTLVDHARRKRAQKRDLGQKIELDDAVSFPSQRKVDLIDLNHGLDELTQFDPDQAKIVELRFFGGLTIEETAHVLGVSPATIKREWTVAKAWLYAYLSRSA